jgi:hypothetical protein
MLLITKNSIIGRVDESETDLACGIVVSVASNISYADTFSLAVKIAQAFSDQARK